MKSGENFNPDNYNVDEEFWKIVQEVTGTPNEQSGHSFDPPEAPTSGPRISEDSLSIPNFKKQTSSPNIEKTSTPSQEFLPPTIEPRLTQKNEKISPEVPNFSHNEKITSDKTVAVESRDDEDADRTYSERHELQKQNIEFGKKVENAIEFTNKFNHALKIHLKRASKEAGENISQKTTELLDRTREVLGNTKERLGERSDDFKKIGRKGLAVTLAVATVAGIGIGSRQLKKGETTVEETTLGYEDDAVIHDKELQDEIGEKYGENIEEIRVDSDGKIVFIADEKKTEEETSSIDESENEGDHLSPSEADLAGEPIANHSKTTSENDSNIPSTQAFAPSDADLAGEPIANHSKTTSENDSNIPSTQTEVVQDSEDSETEISPTEEVAESKTQEISSGSRAEKLNFAKENISVKEAYNNIQNFIDNKEYLNIEGECTADYVAYVLSKTGHSAVQTAAYLGNMAKESKICALLYEVGGDGYGLFQYTAANRHGIKGQKYGNSIYPCEHDGYEIWLEKTDQECYRYEFGNNPLAKVGYGVNNEKIKTTLEATGTKGLYKRAIARQIQYFYYALDSSNWERQQFNKANSATDASTYAKLFEKHVERPASTSDAEKRASIAREAYQLLTSGESLYDLKIN